MKKLKLGFDPLRVQLQNVEQDSHEFRNFENEISCFHEENLKLGLILWRKMLKPNKLKRGLGRIRRSRRLLFLMC